MRPAAREVSPGACQPAPLRASQPTPIPVTQPRSSRPRTPVDVSTYRPISVDLSTSFWRSWRPQGTLTRPRAAFKPRSVIEYLDLHMRRTLDVWSRELPTGVEKPVDIAWGRSGGTCALQQDGPGTALAPRSVVRLDVNFALDHGSRVASGWAFCALPPPRINKISTARPPMAATSGGAEPRHARHPRADQLPRRASTSPRSRDRVADPERRTGPTRQDRSWRALDGRPMALHADPGLRRATGDPDGPHEA